MVMVFKIFNSFIDNWKHWNLLVILNTDSFTVVIR